jgi:hypothetical protein
MATACRAHFIDRMPLPASCPAPGALIQYAEATPSRGGDDDGQGLHGSPMSQAMHAALLCQRDNAVCRSLTRVGDALNGALGDRRAWRPLS